VHNASLLYKADTNKKEEYYENSSIGNLVDSILYSILSGMSAVIYGKRRMDNPGIIVSL